MFFWKEERRRDFPLFSLYSLFLSLSLSLFSLSLLFRSYTNEFYFLVLNCHDTSNSKVHVILYWKHVHYYECEILITDDAWMERRRHKYREWSGVRCLQRKEKPIDKRQCWWNTCYNFEIFIENEKRWGMYCRSVPIMHIRHGNITWMYGRRREREDNERAAILRTGS